MAYSLYAYLDPAILDAGIPYWDAYFTANPWLKEPMNGDEFLFVHVKPRIEDGLDRFTNFWDAVRLADDYVKALLGDDYIHTTPEMFRSLLIEQGYPEYADRIQFE
jgi:hypothetical protein